MWTDDIIANAAAVYVRVRTFPQRTSKNAGLSNPRLTLQKNTAIYMKFLFIKFIKKMVSPELFPFRNALLA